jgi:hypothetical protein
MRDTDPGPVAAGSQAPSDLLLLAALERAALHRARQPARAPFWALLEHLAIPPRSLPGRRLRPRLAALVERQLLTQVTEHGVPMWALTDAAVRGLEEAGRPVLPESPQHLRWRAARTTAAQEVERLRETLLSTLREAERKLERQPQLGSDACFELGRGLQQECRRLGSAWYCLNEWPEPDDGSADLETLAGGDEGLDEEARAARRALRAGRRNVRLWNEPR